MSIKYPQDDWRWYDAWNDEWFCSHECARSYSCVDDHELRRVYRDNFIVTDNRIMKTCRCGVRFEVSKQDIQDAENI